MAEHSLAEALHRMVCLPAVVLERLAAARLYDREPIATRTVQLMPRECWQISPLVYESEDPADREGRCSG